MSVEDAELLREIARGLHGGGFYRSRTQVMALADRIERFTAEDVRKLKDARLFPYDPQVHDDNFAAWFATFVDNLDALVTGTSSNNTAEFA